MWGQLLQDLWREPPLLSGIRDQTGSCSVDIQLPDSFTAMERVAISSDGNLQRIVRSESEGMPLDIYICLIRACPF